jgi:hypothetical protein
MQYVDSTRLSRRDDFGHLARLDEVAGQRVGLHGYDIEAVEPLVDTGSWRRQFPGSVSL